MKRLLNTKGNSAMKRIVCYGDSNTWGYNAETTERFPENVRWPCLLNEYLGDEFQVIEEGLSGRTSVIEDPLFEGLNGLTFIHPCLLSHSPLELVIIMLGTNDTKERFNLTAYNIAQGITRLAIKAKNAVSIDSQSSRVLVVAPPPIGKDYMNTSIGLPMGKDCDCKSEELSIHLEKLLKVHDIEFLDTKGIVSMNHVDYMHLDQEGHKQLSEIIYEKVQSILKGGTRNE